MALPVIDKRIIYAALLLIAAAAALLVPMPEQELVAYRENISYEALIVSEGLPSGTQKTCITTLQPTGEKTCGRDNVSFSVSTVECSNLSASIATYNVHNIADKKGRFDVVVGFSLRDGKTSERPYDRVIDAKTTETFSFSVSTQETEGCFIRVNNALSELECADAVKYSADTTCYGGDALPSLNEQRGTAHREVDKQKFVTVYKPLIEKLMQGARMP